MGGWGFPILLMFFARAAIGYSVEPQCPVPDAVNRYVDSSFLYEGAKFTLRVYYRLLRPFDSKKPTLMVINGGPGGDHHIIDELKSLAGSYNIVGIDHRGVGCTRLLNSVPGTYLPHFYSMQYSVLDLEAIRKDLLGAQGDWFIYGVSYGSMLAQRYALERPAHLLGLILDSTVPSTEGIGFARERFKDLFINSDPNIRRSYENVLWKYPKAKGPVLRRLFRMSYRYKNRLQMQDYLDSIDQVASQSEAEKIYLSTTELPFVGISLQLTCEEVFDYPRKEENIFSMLDVQCAPFRSFRRPMNYTKKLPSLKGRTMIWGGKYDPVTPLPVMEKMAKDIPNSVLYSNDFAGHALLYEKRDCSLKLLSGFLAGETDAQLSAVITSTECQSPPDLLGSSQDDGWYKDLTDLVF